MDIKTISRDELKAKLDRGDDFKLVMVLGGWAFRAQHIPGSIHFEPPEKALAALIKGDAIVVYCSDPACIASMAAYRLLIEHGFTHVQRYAGGLSDWAAAGLSLEGDLV